MARKDSSKSAAQHAPSGLALWWQSLLEKVGRLVRRSLAWTIALALLAGGVYFGLQIMEQKVLAHAAESAPIELVIRLVPTQPWTDDPAEQVPDRLVQRIEGALMPSNMGFYDAGLVAAVQERAAANEWIRLVRRVERTPADPDGRCVVRVECDLRSPVAAVLNNRGEAVAFVDADAVRLPLTDVPRWRLDQVVEGRRQRLLFIEKQDVPVEAARLMRDVPYVGIVGVAGGLPRAGAAWTGADMKDALRVIALLHAADYGREELALVDVSNHAGRDINRAEINLTAQRKGAASTLIRFGRFPHPRADDVIRPERKMTYLDDYVRRLGGGHLAGVHEWIDLQYDAYRIGPLCAPATHQP